jgi:hypothetical protein
MIDLGETCSAEWEDVMFDIGKGTRRAAYLESTITLIENNLAMRYDATSVMEEVMLNHTIVQYIHTA